MTLNHQEGFENEAKFHHVLSEAGAECPTLKARTVMRIINHFAPEFTGALFTIRPCVRELRYIGYWWVKDEQLCEEPPDDYFKIGGHYESIDFNGATYTIKGYSDEKARIGYAYFVLHNA